MKSLAPTLLAIALLTPHAAHAQTKEAAPMQQHATGTFEVKITPLTLDDKSVPATLGRFGISKTIHGDLEATSTGEMLTAKTATPGSQAYVAIEHVTGTLKGRKGTFDLQHRGIMAHGSFELVVTVVPDSGTGELTGLAGTFNIIIADGKHSYDFAYSLLETGK
jgi:hypothetical protein